MNNTDYENLDGQGIYELVSFVENEQEELYGVKILQGPYDGIIYTYGRVNLDEDPKNEKLNVKFDYKINVIPPTFSTQDLENSKDFKDFLGYILIRLIEEKYNEQSPETNH